jgi:serine/threonine protein kinase
MCPACLIRLALEPETGEAPDAEPATVRVLGPVGSGPHGTVYLAQRQHDDPSLVTVKILNTEHQHSIEPDGFCARVRELAARLESIPHAGLTPCLEAGVTAGGRIYVVAPFVAGSPVESYLSNRHRSASERVAIAGRLCALVAHLHRHGIIHGSVRSPNVIVAESPTGAVPSLLDVGILHAINQSRASRSGAALPDDLTACKLHDVLGLRGVLIPLLGDTPVRDTDAARSAEALAALLASP